MRQEAVSLGIRDVIVCLAFSWIYVCHLLTL